MSLEDSAKIPVNSAGTVTIATSKPAVKVGLRSETEGSVKISVANGGKTFATTGTAPTYQNNPTVAQIGYIEVTNVNINITDAKKKIKESDGEHNFFVGGRDTTGDGKPNVAEGDGKVTEGSKDDTGSKQGSWLDIAGGQFAASINSANTVFISSSGIISAGKVNVTDTTAFFGLTNGNLKNIADETAAVTTGTGDAQVKTTGAGIRMEVDEATPIDTLTAPPTAELVIDFVEPYMKDITGVTSDLLQISQDGTVCVVYNLAGPNTQDRFSVRITNTSGMPGGLTGKLYTTEGEGDENGKLLASGNLNGGKDIKSWETVVFHSGNAGETLNADGFTWEGRAMLVITSTLPSLEVMALSRHRNPGSPLSNISAGAMGASCSSQ
ncbi:MAG: hypothetical protein DRR19_23370 [Candidatus Parabeggiatoa sp. nov. 1]|nr:MAG: hypothetical protein DRR19_23370 [Gammaproteobacteria bacterium]